MEQSKKSAAIYAVDKYITSNMIVGIGSGSTIVYAVEHLSQLVKQGKLHNIKCVPSSYQSKMLIINHGLQLTELDAVDKVNVTIDGTDEFVKDEIDGSYYLIKGGGGCLTQEKILAFYSSMNVIICDESKRSDILSKPVPVEVLPLCVNTFCKLLNEHQDDLFLDEKIKSAKIREGTGKAGPLMTDNGCNIIDVTFDTINDPEYVENMLVSFPGVITCGLFIKMTDVVIIGKENGLDPIVV